MSGNRLAASTSPYLQQHADNPVDWYPWGEEALTLARREGKPILLSIGYSACHWCHVMAHESFEDGPTAALMNELFVNVKVDREERPDLDRIYQSAHQLLSGRPGGWPLTVFLTPQDQAPFFAGTYFPREPRHGLPAFTQLLRSIDHAYRTQATEIDAQNRSLIEALRGLNPAPSTGESPGPAPLEVARQQLAASFDEAHGGFGRAPKFPHAPNLDRLLRHWAATELNGEGDARALHMVDHTLTRMALGGINDQVGGGFSRYSVDDQWMIPHFEKMLYDNAPLLSLYAELWAATGKPLFRETAERTAAWVTREMQSPSGGYYSTLDADSEGEEGRFYLWTPDEVRPLLTEEEFRHFAPFYGLDRPPNFEGRWHLHNRVSVAELNERLGSTGQEARRHLESARAKLAEARERRSRPGRDEKILTAWNALMIKGMARAGRLLDRPEFVRSAAAALDFIRSALWREGRLFAVHKDGKSHLPAYLDDHAFLVDALLELLQAAWNREYLDLAVSLADLMLERFADRDAGGFYFTADDHEQLIHRPKVLGDDSTPSGNGVAALALARLGHLLGKQAYLDAAASTLTCAWDQLKQAPYAHCTLLEALDEQLIPPETVLIRGGPSAEPWRSAASRGYAPRRLVMFIPDDESDLPGLLRDYAPAASTRAFICQGTRCEAPLETLKAFRSRMDATAVRPDPKRQTGFHGTAGSFRRPTN